MNLYVISDNVDTQTGMRLAGVEGVVVHTKEELTGALDYVKQHKEIGILLVTEKLAKQFPDEIGVLKIDMPLPLLVEIPDRHGTGRTPDSITSYVKEAIGLKL